MPKRNELAPRGETGGAVDIDGRMDAAKAALEAAETPEDAHRIEAAARAMRELAKVQARSIGEAHRLEIDLAELSVRAMRRTGELLPPPAPGTKPKNKGITSPNLGEVGLSSSEAGRRRAIAAIPADRFEAALAEARAASRPASQTALLALAQQLADPDRLPAKHRRNDAWRKAPLTGAAKLLDACTYTLLDVADACPGTGLAKGVAEAIRELAREVDGLRDQLLCNDERAREQAQREWPGGKGRPESGVARWDREAAKAAADDAAANDGQEVLS